MNAPRAANGPGGAGRVWLPPLRSLATPKLCQRHFSARQTGGRGLLRRSNSFAKCLVCAGLMHGWIAPFRMVWRCSIPIFAVHHSGEEFVMSLINLFVGARNAWKGWRDPQRAFDELMAPDDPSLAEIG